MSVVRKSRRLAAAVVTVAVTAAISVAGGGHAAAGGPPALTGVLFFHNYTGYSNWDGRLWELNLATGQLASISDAWPVDNEMNAHASPDGQRLVFMGDLNTDTKRDWDVFLSTWNGSSSPVLGSIGTTSPSTMASWAFTALQTNSATSGNWEVTFSSCLV